MLNPEAKPAPAGGTVPAAEKKPEQIVQQVMSKRAAAQAEDRRRGRARRARKANGTEYYEELMAQMECNKLDNASFSEARAPRYKRLYRRVEVNERSRLGCGAPGDPITGLTQQEWKEKAEELLHGSRGERKQDEGPLNLWNMVCDAEEIRQESDEACARDGYMKGQALVVINGVHTLCVGRAIPVNGDHCCTCFLCEYTDAAAAAAEGNGEVCRRDIFYYYLRLYFPVIFLTNVISIDHRYSAKVSYDRSASNRRRLSTTTPPS